MTFLVLLSPEASPMMRPAWYLRLDLFPCRDVRAGLPTPTGGWGARDRAGRTPGSRSSWASPTPAGACGCSGLVASSLRRSPHSHRARCGPVSCTLDANMARRMQRFAHKDEGSGRHATGISVGRIGLRTSMGVRWARKAVASGVVGF